MTPNFQERNTRLLELMHLSPEDIAMNRSGSISPAQYDRIEEQLRTVWRRLVYFFIVMTVPPMLIAIFVSSPTLKFIFGLLAFSSAFFFLRIWQQIRPQQAAVRRDLDQNAVGNIEGRVQKKIENENDYYLIINEKRFLVYPDIYHLVEQNASIGVYYLTESQKLLSLEYLLPFIEENMTL